MGAIASLSPVGGGRGGDFLGELTGANKTAEEYGKAAAGQLDQQRTDRSMAMKYAVSDEELQQLQQSIALNNQDIARKQKILASADPALIEAGNQALQLMQGKNAASLKPLQDQRAQQRQQLQQTLAQQLGSDYATSSQGRAALNQFDQQTANTMTGAQQEAIGKYMNYATVGEQVGNLGQNMDQMNTFSSIYGNQAGRRTNAITGNRVDASLGNAGALYKARAGQGYMDQIFGAGLNYLSPGSGGGGGKKPTAGPSTMGEG